MCTMMQCILVFVLVLLAQSGECKIVFILLSCCALTLAIVDFIFLNTMVLVFAHKPPVLFDSILQH